MRSLTEFPLVYLATPYSKYKAGIDCAFRDASALAARLLKLHVRVYSPIAHCHPIAEYGAINPLDHAIWIPFDEAMMTAASALLVAQMQGWRDSYGITHEIAFFKAAGKPVFYLETMMMTVADVPHGFRAEKIFPVTDVSVAQPALASHDANQTEATAS